MKSLTAAGQRMQSGNRAQLKMKYIIVAGMAVALSVAATGVFLDRPVKQQIRPITLEQVHCAVYQDC